MSSGELLPVAMASLSCGQLARQILEKIACSKLGHFRAFSETVPSNAQKTVKWSRPNAIPMHKTVKRFGLFQNIRESYLKRYQALTTTTKQRNDDDLQRQQ
ncbi:hypothetical protein ACHAWT_000954, partial [Skeletonema menzelii]